MAKKTLESSWEEHDEVVEIEVKQPLDKVIPIRLTAENWKALHDEARELGVGPTTLARMWILAKLRELQRSSSKEVSAPPSAHQDTPRKRGSRPAQSPKKAKSKVTKVGVQG